MLAGLMLIAGCTQPRPLRTAGTHPERDSREEPSTILEGFEMTSIRGVSPEWTFQARRAEIFERLHLAKAVEISVAYLKKAEKISWLRADFGSIQTETHRMQVEGHVVMISKDGVVLETESLQWEPDSKKIVTKAPVLVRRGQSVLTGEGLVANTDLEDIRILKNVKIELRSLRDAEQQRRAIEGTYR
jgi:LPS export ABC transporter protein LptC